MSKLSLEQNKSTQLHERREGIKIEEQNRKMDKEENETFEFEFECQTLP